jgi:hypothetical protein
MEHVDQVGGKHYQAEIQHWDICEQYDVDYLTATATKYLTRWRKKGTPKLDLGKAASYIEKALKCRPGQGARRLVPQDQLNAFYAANRIHWMDGELISALLASGSRGDFEATLEKVREMEEHAE